MRSQIRGALRRLKSGYRSISMRFPARVQCNICGWQGRHFNSDSWHPYTICWNCNSEVRHRLLAEALQTIPKFSYQILVNGKDILHFGPEPVLTQILKQRANLYQTADLFTPADLRIDISNMSQIRESRYDLLIACDVLEHVEKEADALKEIYRILRYGGYAIITVPQKDNLENTYEDRTITDPVGREHAFGQSDHLRIYGNNFSKILENANFEVTVVSEKEFDQALVKKHVLFPPILSSHPLATNYRKIFFARKQKTNS